MSATFAPTRHKLSVEDYHKVGDAGVLTEDSRVELISGELIDLAPIGSLHASVVTTLSMFFARHVGDRAIVSTQNPVILPPDSEPQPDIALLKPSADRYRNALPTASDVLLIIEVADTTLDYDRTIKLPRYARHGIPEMWIVDLQSRRIEVYREPGTDRYSQCVELRTGDVASPSMLPTVTLSVDEIFS